ncbi:MAG TPA: endonuclease MutS2 [Dissulfurispiraceae bacterium]|nr:endonuclease MutS2 [Dissulfurispiraceae bacterium]
MISSHSLSLLEFDKLLRIIASFSNSGATEAAVGRLAPFSNRSDIERRQCETADVMRLSSQGVSLGLYPFPDIRDLFGAVRPEGAVLEGIELAAFAPVFGLISDIYANVSERSDIPVLRELTDGLTGFPNILKLLRRSIDSQGGILDTASSALAVIRSGIRRLESRIRRKLEDMTRNESLSVFLQDDFVTTRSGRWVIPVRMDSKGQVPGVVHDVSKSGETAFVEPLAIIGFSNELENLAAEEKAEEIRILRSISALIREQLPDIEHQFSLLIHIDLLHGIAQLADAMKMQMPGINETISVNLIDGRHPLLALNFRKHSAVRQVVPLSVKLGGENSVMVITGSNAGGKTIAIKTIGLLTLMALTGMPVPADSSSSFPMVRELLMDIGDEQSIENDLSTFSAHIAHISEILKEADTQTMVLLDELGTGTDPVEGAALACAVLKELKERGALLFATTHLMDIKGFVHRTAGMLNASMEFDQNTLSPLYRLRIGEPGQSHAIEIARRYGLPDSVVDSAKALLGGVKIEFDNLIRDLTEKRAYYENAIAEIDAGKAEMEEQRRALDEMKASVRREQDDLMEKSYREMSELAASVKRELYALLDAAKKADKEKIRESLRLAETRRKEIDKALSAQLSPETAGAPSLESLKKGDVVYVKSIEADAQVVSVDSRRERVRVRCGSVEVEIPYEGLQKKKGRDFARASSNAGFTKAVSETASSDINIIGLHVDEALSRIEPFLNHAALAGLREVSVIHGIGTGALRKAVREHLEGHPLVAGFRGGEQPEGGQGVTVVTLK